MAHPEWVLKHKLRGTEIRCIKGKYYLYNYTTVWSPEKKRAKKKTLNQVGVITKEYGLIPTGMSRKGKIPAGESKLKVDAKSETNFLDKFEGVNDVRSERNKLYSVVEILLVTLLAVICGAEGWKDVENYGKAKINYLRTYFNFTYGIPSDDTFRRFFRSIDPDHFQKIFCEWVRNLVKTVNAKVIAIDGKSSRRSYDGDDNMLHMVSAFSTDARIVLGQEKVDDKSNEITAIPKLLELLDIKNHIITIDAMGCQYEIANKIIKKEGDYVFSLKGNQGNLSSDVALYFEGIGAKTKNKSYTDHDKGHGRIEVRECVVCNDMEWLRSRHPKWQSIKSIARVQSTREIQGKVTEEARYYVSSLDVSAKEMLGAIRSHWAIENSLHWVLDMSFNEDYSRIRKENAPQVMAIIRHMALNILQQNRLPRQSIKGTRKLCAWSDATLTELLAKFKSS